ncbi:17934_t:CDS:2 [Gigaspora rosea]|nr:17934_t:CDS:2 [Gigaspora rosea]
MFSIKIISSNSNKAICSQDISDTSDGEYTSEQESSTTLQKKRKYTGGKKDDECPTNWSRGRPYDMKVHLARTCNFVPEDIKHTTPISDTKAKELDQAILKAWVCYGFSFHTIENPFIINLFKLAIPGYTLLPHTILSGNLLEQENARIEKKITNNLKKAENLTLS